MPTPVPVLDQAAITDCAECGCRVNESVCTPVNTGGRNTVDWCPSCLSSLGANTRQTTCSRCSVRMAPWANYESTVDGQFVCAPCYSGIRRCECGSYRYADGNCAQCADGPVAQMEPYHGSRVRRGWPRPFAGCWGMEIELNATKRPRACYVAKSHNWSPERDGSLPESTGLEIISGPMTYDSLADSVSSLIADLPDGCSGWNAPDGNSFGIHISFDTRKMSVMTLMRFCMFINRNPLRLCEFVAGRTESERYARFDPNGSSRYLTSSVSARIMNPDKYCAVNIKNSRCEVRIFRSTLNASSAVACMEFVRSVIDYSEHSNPLWSDEALVRDYMKFIEGNPKRYRNLRHRLAKFSRSEVNRRDFSSLVLEFPKQYAKMGLKTETVEV